MKRGYIIRKIFDYLGAIFLLGLLFFLWMLYHGPLSVPFLKPYIIEALNSEQTVYTMDIGTVNLELVRSIQPLKIIAKDIRFKKNDDNISITAPKLFLSFSVRALLKGLIAPSNIYIENPSVSIFTTYGVEKDKENEVNIKKVAYYTDSFKNFLEHFNSADKIYPESYINEIKIENAAVEFHEVDLGQKWLFSDMNIEFHRNFTNLELSAGGVVDLSDRMATLKAAIHFNPIREKMKLNIDFEDVVTSDFIKEIGGGISSINVPLSGQIEARINFAEMMKNTGRLSEHIDRAVEKIDFKVKSAQGVVEFENNPHFDYNIDSFSFDGQILGGLDVIELKNAELNIGKQKANLDFKITGYKKYFLEKSIDDLKLSLGAKVNFLLMNDLARFWPRYYAEPAWAWCKESLYGGTYQNALFNFEWAYDKQNEIFTLSKLKGKADIQDGTIYYLEGMPIVTNVYGTALFDIGVIDIVLDKGISDGLMLDSGRVKLYDLDKEQNFIDIKIMADTNVKDALAYISHPPLDFGNEISIDPENIKGETRIDLGLAFELYQDLKPEEIKVNVKADISNMVIKNITPGKTLKLPKADVKVSSKNYTVKGDAFYDDIPVSFDFKQNLRAPNTTKGTFKLRVDQNVLQKLNIQNTLLEAPYLEGFAFITVNLSGASNKDTTVDIKANLENTAIDYSFLGFNKALNEQGDVEAKITLKNKKFYAVPYFHLTKDKFSLSGNVTTDQNFNVKTINVENIKGPKTSAAAKIEFQYKPQKNIKINVSGNSYDLTELFVKREKKQKENAKQISESGDDDLKSAPNTEVFIAVNSLWTNPDTPIKNFAGSAVLKHGVGIDDAHLIGNYGSDKSVKFTLDYTKKSNGEHYLTIDSNNAGSTLRVLRLYENMNGGILKIEAKKDLNENMIGHAKIRDFKIADTPLLAKLLSVASFSGMLDLLKGDGLVFSHFDAPFSYKNKTLQITDAKMFGNVLGLTASGKFNRLTSDINIRGIISPAYSLNTMVGRIPFVGSMLAGKDGTVFAVDYDISNTLDDPKININPLSILSPNAVKDLFEDD